MLAIRNYLVLLICSVVCLNCTESEQTSDTAKQSPNIVLIISDDQSWTDYSFMGHKTIETPNIDKLANTGLTFTHGYATAPLCSPSLASIITGLYPHQAGILGNDPIFESKEKKYTNEWMIERRTAYQKYIDQFKEVNTIADLLGEKGYISLQTGKWWLGNYSTGGFDQGMTHGDPSKGGRHGDEGLKIGREGMEEIFNFIDSAQQSNTPFFLWYAPFLPHSPHTPPEALLEKYLALAPTPAVARYWAMCEWFDLTCGQLMDYVETKGINEQTLFVYVTDNGWIQNPDRPNRYAPRSKREPYEMGIRTPIVFKWEGSIKPNMDTTTAVSAIDIATTILEICGIEPEENMQGINVLNSEVLKARDLIFAENYSHDFTTVDSSLLQRIAIDMPYKLILPDTTNQPEASIELFNIVEDPHEKNNLADAQSRKVDLIQDKIRAWWEDE